MQAQRRRARYQARYPDFAGWRLRLTGLQPQITAGPGLLKLPVLAASTSLRRSRKAGAARMDAG
ncbi:hypothetical protein H7U18_06795 [Klebsiella pneumoniae]|uniref:Uncharacterized protein n=1 Tax=Klebsiella pneumoniae TaxID=573 RepID=A0A923EPI1_KLEPN|nr:hypothetical protein [Klebsiella pneumoniae]